MKFALSSLLALSLTPTATSSTLNKLSPRVISHETSHHCDDLTTAGHTTHGDCDDRKRHLASGGDVALSQTHVSSNDPITLTPKSWKATNERDDMYTVVLNFGSHDALSLSDLAQQVEVHVTHDLGTDIKTFDLALVASHGLDVAVGSYPMGTTTPTVTLKYPSFVQTVDRRRLAVSHVSYRKLRELGEEYHVRSAGAYQGVGSQGGCGDCYAWAARGVANEIERRVDGNGEWEAGARESLERRENRLFVNTHVHGPLFTHSYGPFVHTCVWQDSRFATSRVRLTCGLGTTGGAREDGWIRL